VTGAPRRIRTFDLPLRRSFRGHLLTAAYLARAGLLGVWLQLSVPGFRPVLARGWHEVCTSMRTVGILLLGIKLPSSACLWARAQDGHGVQGLMYLGACTGRQVPARTLSRPP
jgi:hypothetical protein